MRLSDLIADKKRNLDEMELNSDELKALKWTRSSIYTYGSLLGVLGAGSGVAIAGSSAPILSKLISSVIFASIGSILGASYGLQRGLVRISGMESNLAKELAQLDDLKEQLKKRRGRAEDSSAITDRMEADLESIFLSRAKKRE
jgi:hypothetical protein